MREGTNEGLSREVRRWDLVAMVVNAIVGASIFALPSKIFSLTGTYSLLAFLVCAVSTGFLALCFAEVSSRFTETGGPYLYARHCFGPVIGFEVGWLLFLFRMMGFATVCNLLVSYLAFFVPALEIGVWRVVSIGVICAAFTFINVVGVRVSALATDLFTISKIIPLVLFVLAGLFFINPRNYSAPARPDFQSFSTAMILLVFAFGGYEGTTVTAGEVQQPRHNFPFAILMGVALTAVLFILIQFVCIGLLPDLAHSERPIADASRQILGVTGASVIAIGAIVSMVGNLNGTLLGVPRVPFAMAERGQLPSLLAATHNRFRTPHVAILFSSAVMFVLTLSHSFMSALTFTALIRLIMYAITASSLLVLRRKSEEHPAGFAPVGGVFVAIVSLILCGWLISSCGWRELRGVCIFLATGLVIHFAYRWWHATAGETLSMRPQSSGRI